jgi:hypothetical protein
VGDVVVHTEGGSKEPGTVDVAMIATRVRGRIPSCVNCCVSKAT